MNQLIERIRQLVSGKNTGILGFGLEGQSTLRFIRQHIGDIPIHIADRDDDVVRRAGEDFSVKEVSFHTGAGYLDSLRGLDILFKSPGVGLPVDFLEGNAGLRVVSQTELVLEEYHRQMIGVTGTKGKSTTSSLIHHILSLAGKRNILAGNIGVPVFDSLDRVQPDTIIICELSSHQLEGLSLSPHISVLLNLFPEHLDRYGSQEEYFRSKWNIFRHRGEDDILILCDEIAPEDLPGEDILSRGRLLRYGHGKIGGDGAYLEGGRAFISTGGVTSECCHLEEDFFLKGRHNKLNALAAILACHEAGASYGEIKEGVRSFHGLEHRLEYVGHYGGIHYYNDSIATIPEATLEAVHAINNIGTLILGGYDRGLDYTRLTDALMESPIRNFIFMGPAGKRMHRLATAHRDHGKHQLFIAESLEEAFVIIRRETPAGTSCLLSPAAASYDSFKNFEERGLLFKKIARSR